MNEQNIFYADKTLYAGRPENPAGRSEEELKVYDMLDGLGIPYRRADHDPAMTMDDCEIVAEIIGLGVCKNLFLRNRQGTEHYLLMMPGRKRFRTAVVSKLLGVSRLSFGTPEELWQYLHLRPGSVSIMALAYDKEEKVKLVIDADLARGEYMRCHPCINTSTLKIATQDILNKYLPFIHHTPIFIEIKDNADQ